MLDHIAVVISILVPCVQCHRHIYSVRVAVPLLENANAALYQSEVIE